VALAVPVAPPTIAARQAMQLVIELLVDESLAGDALLALTGRRALAANFSVL
jgi:hypothetical protein